MTLMAYHKVTGQEFFYKGTMVDSPHMAQVFGKSTDWERVAIPLDDLRIDGAEHIKLIEDLKAYALEKYNEGGDGFVEAYEDYQWVDFIKKALTANEDPMQALQESIVLMAEVRVGYDY